MKVLILGGGAREHALGWKLKQQGECHDIWIHPGNPGTKRQGFSDFGFCETLDDLVAKAEESRVDLVIVGPENLLEKGVANAFRKHGIRVVGPNQEAAKLETSKIFAKEFLLSAKIPTAPSQVFSSHQELLSHSNKDWPWVLKLDGLASGKGVVIAQSTAEVRAFANAVWENHTFGSGPHKVLAEQFVAGKEISYIGFCDGRTFIPLASATDHKRVFNGNRGPNTGGMGAISPSPHLTPDLENKIQDRVIIPFLKKVSDSQLDFRGILFVGLMVDGDNNPNVLEFNTRFGDPETQCVLPRLESSFLSLLLATAEGRLNQIEPPQWDSKTSVTVVACSEGYPESPTVGAPISGLDSIDTDTFLFFGGIAESRTGLTTGGGRVLGIGALESSPIEAREKAYQTLSKIHWPGIHFRTDIGT